MFGSQKAMSAASQVAAQQVAAGSMGRVPGGRGGFEFFPTQIGEPRPFAKRMRPFFAAIVVYQALMAVVAIIEFMNLLSGIIMILGVLLGFFTFSRGNMEITYVCYFGVLSFAGFIAGIVGALIGFAVLLSTIVVKFNIPLSCLFGMAISWSIFKDYEENTPSANDHLGSWLRALGLLAPPVTPRAPPGGSAAMLGAFNVPHFGGSMNADDIKKQADAGYGSMNAFQTQAFGQADNSYANMKEFQTQALLSAHGYGAQAEAQAKAGMSQAQGFFSSFNAAPAPQPTPQPPGMHDTKYDPFMTM